MYVYITLTQRVSNVFGRHRFRVMESPLLPPAPSSLDSKLKRVTRLRKLNEHQCKMI